MAIRDNRRWHKLKRWKREDRADKFGKPKPRPLARQDGDGDWDWDMPIPTWVDARGVRQGGRDGIGWTRLEDR